jgi:phosphate transport system protein
MLLHRITELKRKITEMAALVERMVAYSYEGMDTGNNKFSEVMDYEQRVNKLEMEIEDDCIVLIALHHPEAKNLRVILMIYKINNDLERLGDQAVNIAESVNSITGNPHNSDIPELASMMNVTLKMLHQSIVAYTNEDVENAQLVCRQDEIVDSYNRHIMNQLVALIKENPLQAEYYLHLLRISKNLERIADLSTNISENTIYMVQGRIIKHHIEDIDKQN